MASHHNRAVSKLGRRPTEGVPHGCFPAFSTSLHPGGRTRDCGHRGRRTPVCQRFGRVLTVGPRQLYTAGVNPRHLLAAAFAAVLLGVAALTLMPGVAPTAQAACSDGEEEDVFTTTCTPFMVPNSPSPFSAIPGNPDIAASDGIPCTGGNAGQCIGLAEEAAAEGPPAVPRSTISASP